MEHSVVDLDYTVVSRDRQRVAWRTVVVDEVAVVERRQHVAVHDHECAVQPVYQAEWRRSSESGFLADVRNVDLTAVAAVEDSLDQVCEVADAELDVDDPRFRELPDHDLEDRTIAHRHEWLWKHRGVRRQSCPTTSSQDHGGHRFEALLAVRVAVRLRARGAGVGNLERSHDHGYDASPSTRIGDLGSDATSVTFGRGVRFVRRPVSRCTATSRPVATAYNVHQRILASMENEWRAA